MAFYLFTVYVVTLLLVILAEHLDGRQHKNKICALSVGIDGVRFICHLCSDSPFDDKEWLCGHVHSPVHHEKLEEELFRFWGWRDSML